MTHRVVVFDMDDTLFPEVAYVFSGFEAVGRVVEERYGVTGFAATACALHEAGARGDVFNRSAAVHGLPTDAASISELVNVYRAHEPRIALDSAMAAILTGLRARRCKVALLTDGPPIMQRAKINALAIDPAWDAVVVSDELGGAHLRKPHARPYQRVMELIGESDTRRYLYVGDNPAKDFIGARRMGWASVRLRISGRLHAQVEPAAGYEADAEVTDGAALAKLLGL